MAIRTAFITGASSGLGRGLAVHYAKQGATVFAAARRKDRLLELADEVAAASGDGRIEPVELDASDTAALVAAIRAAEAKGALDLVVANAGIGGPTPGKALEWKHVERILHLDATAACVTLAAAAPAMVARGSGRLVGVSSLAGLRGLPGHAAYSAAKAALDVFLEGLRVDLRGSGVAVTCIYPGFVKTEMTAKNRFHMPLLMELDDAVRAMSRGIDRKAAHVSFPLPLAAAMRGVRALPSGLYEALASALGGKVG